MCEKIRSMTQLEWKTEGVMYAENTEKENEKTLRKTCWMWRRLLSTSTAPRNSTILLVLARAFTMKFTRTGNSCIGIDRMSDSNIDGNIVPGVNGSSWKTGWRANAWKHNKQKISPIRDCPARQSSPPYWLYNAAWSMTRWTSKSPDIKTTVWVKRKSTPNFSDIFPQQLRIFSPNFTHLLYVPIYAGLQIFIQLPATLMKLCHIKRDHHNVLKMSTIDRNIRWVVALNMA